MPVSTGLDWASWCGAGLGIVVGIRAHKMSPESKTKARLCINFMSIPELRVGLALGFRVIFFANMEWK